MINRGKLWVIPNEVDIIQEVFERDVESGKSHTYRLQEFSDMYQLGFEFNEDDYHVAPCEIVKLGHMVIKSEEEVSLVVCYLPEVITDRQYNWLYQNNEKISEYMQISAFSLDTQDNDEWKKNIWYGTTNERKC